MPSWTDKALKLLTTYSSAASGEVGWQSAHETVVRILGGHAGPLLVRHGNGAIEPLAMPGFSPEAHTLYAAHYHSVDLWLQATWTRQAREAVLDGDLVDRGKFDRSEIWNDYGRHHNRAYYLLGGIVPLDNGATAIIGINRPDHAEPFDMPDKRRFEALIPGLSQSLSLFLRLRAAQLQADISRVAMDAVATPIAVTDAAGILHFANQAAHEILSRRGGAIRLARIWSGQHQVQARGSGDAQLLAQRLASAATGGPGGPVALKSEDGSHALTALVYPLPASETIRHALGPADRNGLALVLFSDPEHRSAVNGPMLRELYQLSEAELEVLRALMQGHTAEKLAEMRGVSITTARTQIRSLLHKTASENIKGLVQMVSSLPGVRGG